MTTLTARTYRKRGKFRLSEEDAQSFGVWLEAEATANAGRVTIEGLLQTAADPVCPIHHLLEWDDGKAAHEHRLSQMRYFVRAVEVVVVEANDEPEVTRPVVVHIPESTGEYMLTEIAVQDADLWQAVLAEVKKRVEDMIDRYKHYEGIASILDEALAKLRAIE